MPGGIVGRMAISGRHLRLGLPRLAQCLLPGRPTAAALARVLRDPVRHRRGKQRLPPAALVRRLRQMARAAPRRVHGGGEGERFITPPARVVRRPSTTTCAGARPRHGCRAGPSGSPRTRMSTSTTTGARPHLAMPRPSAGSSPAELLDLSRPVSSTGPRAHSCPGRRTRPGRCCEPAAACRTTAGPGVALRNACRG